jgi:hypothetical protein
MLELTTLGEIRLRATQPDRETNGLAGGLLRQTKPLSVFLYLATNGRLAARANI